MNRQSRSSRNESQDGGFGRVRTGGAGNCFLGAATPEDDPKGRPPKDDPQRRLCYFRYILSLYRQKFNMEWGDGGGKFVKEMGYDTNKFAHLALTGRDGLGIIREMLRRKLRNKLR